MSSWAPPGGASTRLVLVRHGSTEHSLARRFSGRNTLPLDAAGEAQAAALAARDHGDVTAVVSSPLIRTTQTAAAIARRLGLTVETCDDLVETDFGEWEGSTFAEVRERWPAELAAWAGSPDVAPPGGESFTEVTARVGRVRDALLDRYAGRTVVVVSHVTPIKTLLCLAIEAPPVAMYRIHLDTASVSIVDYAADRTPSVRLVNETSHLRHQEETRR
ncbi:histidine phosphatase family protein [Jatrophihabitans endophyticus]|uniref:histidine phosphatase family protein n=1 Tax=Jatrophihabitans endophyticus TaxID=1206085 RepID=UPI0019EAD234|nr:histidine phosphatase family protein [Jatrophihabitans endophyticus]MBE7187934.1 histidine phosphatase family protein [Jatrophihabitans endophyticus]